MKSGDVSRWQITLIWKEHRLRVLIVWTRAHRSAANELVSRPVITASSKFVRVLSWRVVRRTRLEPVAGSAFEAVKYSAMAIRPLLKLYRGKAEMFHELLDRGPVRPPPVAAVVFNSAPR
jgi:hypothetical protein